jgi:hypothetical protein
VELDEVVEHVLDVVERVGPVLVAGELDGVPDLLGGRRRGDPLDLPLELLERTGDADPTQQRQLAQPGEPLAQAQLLGRVLGALSGQG